MERKRWTLNRKPRRRFRSCAREVDSGLDGQNAQGEETSDPSPRRDREHSAKTGSGLAMPSCPKIGAKVGVRLMAWGQCRHCCLFGSSSFRDGSIGIS